MSLAFVTLVSCVISSDPAAFWIDAEKFYEQSGSARAGSVIEFAAGGKGLGSGWGGKKADSVEFRFITPRTMRGVALCLGQPRSRKAR